MRDFTNERVSKEYNKLKIMFYIGAGLVVLASVVFGWYAMQDTKSMHQLILDVSKEGQTAHINATHLSDYFAYYPGKRDKFYFAMDEEDYMYIVRMSPSSYTKISNKIDTEKTYKMEGVTKNIPSDIKKIALEVYNEILEEEDQLTIDDFENYFGAIYLDLESSKVEPNDIILVIMVFLGLFGFGFGLYGGVGVWRFKRKINKLTFDERQEIDKEMNEEDAFYYSNAHLYLTDNYIVNFASTFDAIQYKDIIWVYKFVQRRNGIKASQSVVVMTKNGKTHTIATLNGLTKKAKDVFDEILETIAKKSTNALIGYTSENRKNVKGKIEK